MQKIIITAGGTSEKIDNVRKITNSGTGKLGLAIANHLAKKDVMIYYICSKNAVRPSNVANIKVIEIENPNDLKRAIENLLTTEKIVYFIHSMAVSDYTTDYVTTIERIKNSLKSSADIEEAFRNIQNLIGSKISSSEDNLVIVLKPTPKIISMIKTLSPETYLVGFKLLDNVSKEHLIEVATKLCDKNHCDLVVTNDLEDIRNGNHLAFIFDKQGAIEEAYDKEDIARKLSRKMFTY